MFNLLTDEMPTTVAVDGAEISVNWQWHKMVAVERVLQDPTLDQKDQVLSALILFYGADRIPDNVSAATEAMFAFYKGEEKPLNDAQLLALNKHKNAPPVRSFDHDDEFIFAAFFQQYGIRLTQARDLHWYEFRALLRALDDCPLTRIMSWRGKDLAEIKDPAERRRQEKQKRYWEIPDPLSEERRKAADELKDILLHGGDLSKLSTRGDTCGRR